MKKILVCSLFLSLAFLAACGPKEKPVFTGFWKGEDASMLFEVFQNAPGENSYTIRNIFGDLQAKIEGDSILKGENSLGMPYVMRVRKDSAFYEFETIVSTYSRIDEKSYREQFEAFKKEFEKSVANEAPATTEIDAD